MSVGVSHTCLLQANCRRAESGDSPCAPASSVLACAANTGLITHADTCACCCGACRQLHGRAASSLNSADQLSRVSGEQGSLASNATSSPLTAATTAPCLPAGQLHHGCDTVICQKQAGL